MLEACFLSVRVFTPWHCGLNTCGGGGPFVTTSLSPRPETPVRLAVYTRLVSYAFCKLSTTHTHAREPVTFRTYALKFCDARRREAFVRNPRCTWSATAAWSVRPTTRTKLQCLTREATFGCKRWQNCIGLHSMRWRLEGQDTSQPYNYLFYHKVLKYSKCSFRLSMRYMKCFPFKVSHSHVLLNNARRRLKDIDSRHSRMRLRLYACVQIRKTL